ncbi:MAG: integrase family protein [Myxococcales bacterium]|nr:integrase family protein [Myxococcales bacterium]
MIEHFVSEQEARVLRASPLGAHLDTFAAELVKGGYRRFTGQIRLRVLKDLGSWLAASGRGVSDLGEPLVTAYLKERRRKCRHGSRRGLHAFLELLRRVDVIAPAVVAEGSAADQLRLRYETYLQRERGLAPVTIEGYRPFVHRFLDEHPRASLHALGSADVSRFLLQCAGEMSRARAKLLATALRSLFRFLFREELTSVDLTPAVLSVANWRYSSVPRHLDTSQVERVIAAVSSEPRDHAIVLLLARLGLRALEIVMLELSDIDWRIAEITVPGKGAVRDRLPLPSDVGQALATYLRDVRPRSSSRRVFLCARAPYHAFSGSSVVSTVVARALRRAGIDDPPSHGAHLLRHSLATTLLKVGASMSEIGEVLRHRSPTTTEIYAKVDLTGLRTLAQSWPVLGETR